MSTGIQWRANSETDWNANGGWGFATDAAQAVVVESDIEVVDDFSARLSEWRKAVGVHSLASKRIAHPSFKRILELGDAIVPDCLVELAEGNTDVIEVLRALALPNAPVLTDADKASRQTVTQAWVRWGQKRNG